MRLIILLMLAKLMHWYEGLLRSNPYTTLAVSLLLFAIVLWVISHPGRKI